MSARHAAAEAIAPARTSRILWIESLKGIACVMVFVHHFFVGFYPAHHYGVAGAPTHLSGLDARFGASPLSFIINGQFYVTIFCLLSGFVIALQVMRYREMPEKLGEVVVKRYLRLMLPVVPIGMTFWAMLRYGLLTHVAANQYAQSPWFTFHTEPVSFTHALYSVFIGIWMDGDYSLSNAYWMLGDMFIGSFLAIILAVGTYKASRHSWLIFPVAMVLLFPSHGLLILFAAGGLLAWLHQRDAFRRLPAWTGILLIAAGLFLGGYPTDGNVSSIYNWKLGMVPTDIHGIGAFLLCLGIFALPRVQSTLSIRPFVFLGRISYAVYLIHIALLFSVTTWIFTHLYEGGMAYWMSCAVSFAVSLALLIVLSALYNRYVEKWCAALTAKAMRAYGK